LLCALKLSLKLSQSCSMVAIRLRLAHEQHIVSIHHESFDLLLQFCNLELSDGQCRDTAANAEAAA